MARRRCSSVPGEMGSTALNLYGSGFSSRQATAPISLSFDCTVSLLTAASSGVTAKAGSAACGPGGLAPSGAPSPLSPPQPFRLGAASAGCSSDAALCTAWVDCVAGAEGGVCAVCGVCGVCAVCAACGGGCALNARPGRRCRGRRCRSPACARMVVVQNVAGRLLEFPHGPADGLADFRQLARTKNNECQNQDDYELHRADAEHDTTSPSPGLAFEPAPLRTGFPR